jgi:hypothetical protein
MAGIPQYRVPSGTGIRVFDATLGLIACFVLVYAVLPGTLKVGHRITIGLCVALFILFPVAILAHWLFSVPTRLNYALGLSPQPTLLLSAR